jgi:hypothetical protein
MHTHRARECTLHSWQARSQPRLTYPHSPHIAEKHVCPHEWKCALQSQHAREINKLARWTDRERGSSGRPRCTYLEETAYTFRCSNRTKGAEIAPERKHAWLSAKVRGRRHIHACEGRDNDGLHRQHQVRPGVVPADASAVHGRVAPLRPNMFSRPRPWNSNAPDKVGHSF